MLRSFLLLTLVSLFSGSLRAIVVASGDGSSAVVAFNQVVDGVNLNGVVELGTGCSGSLLSDGYSILTAAHCIASSLTSVDVYFPGPSGSVEYTATPYAVDPLFTGESTQGNDLAILRLNQAAPSSATRYSLYTGFFTTSIILLAGYGETGNGTTGVTGGFGTLRQGQNQYIGLGGDVFTGWSNDLLVGQFVEDSDIPNEVDIGPGDSGGPSFYDGQIIGVHDVVACISATSSGPCTDPPSASPLLNSSFGQFFGDTSVSSSASWIESEETPEPASCSMVLLGLAVAEFLRRRTGRRPS
jgi:hypothetical protein